MTGKATLAKPAKHIPAHTPAGHADGQCGCGAEGAVDVERREPTIAYSQYSVPNYSSLWTDRSKNLSHSIALRGKPTDRRCCGQLTPGVPVSTLRIVACFATKYHQQYQQVEILPLNPGKSAQCRIKAKQDVLAQNGSQWQACFQAPGFRPAHPSSPHGPSRRAQNPSEKWCDLHHTLSHEPGTSIMGCTGKRRGQAIGTPHGPPCSRTARRRTLNGSDDTLAHGTPKTDRCTP